jgi:hypothetical protein
VWLYTCDQATSDFLETIAFSMATGTAIVGLAAIKLTAFEDAGSRFALLD